MGLTCLDLGFDVGFAGLVLGLLGLNFGLDGLNLRLESGIVGRNWGIYLGLNCIDKGLDQDLPVLSWDRWVFFSLFGLTCL